MFFRLFSIEWTRLTKRALPWFFLAACALFTAFSQRQFYVNMYTDIVNGSIKLPGLAFDLASPLDGIMSVSQPLIVILAAVVVGNDYSQRTNQHWLTRAARPTTLWAKFAVLAGVAFAIQVVTLLAGVGAGWYFKTFMFHSFSLTAIHVWALVEALFYMTLVDLPTIALMILLTVAVRSTFASLAIGLGYTLFIETLLASFFAGHAWTGWLIHNLGVSATFLLNDIGFKTVTVPAYLLQPPVALIVASVYSLVFMAAAAWLYRRQDLGG